MTTSTPDSIEDFEPHLGTPFTLATGDEDAGQELELIEVKDLTVEDENRSPGVRAHPFRLTFRSAERKKYFQQQLVHLSHGELGTLNLFLVPIGPDETGMRYEAVFN